MNAQRNLAVSVALFCLAMPPVAVNANVTPDATGIVSCKVNYEDGTSARVEYPVGYFWLEGIVVDRWGPGYDIKYGNRGVGTNLSNFALFVYSIVDPNNPDTFEELYSETGKLNFRVDRNRKMQIDGKSFVVMETDLGGSEGFALTAECTWKLSGILPLG